MPKNDHLFLCCGAPGVGEVALCAVRAARESVLAAHGRGHGAAAEAASADLAAGLQRKDRKWHIKLLFLVLSIEKNFGFQLCLRKWEF